MKQIIKDNFGLIMVSLETTINDFESFLEDLADNDLKDSPLKNIENTIEAYKTLRDCLKSDVLSDYNYSQIKAIMEYRLNVLKTQKKKIDETIPLVENLIKNLNSEN